MNYLNTAQGLNTNREGSLFKAILLCSLSISLFLVPTNTLEAQTLDYAFLLGNSSSSSLGSTIVVDDEGNSYVTGYLRNTVDFDPSEATYYLTGSWWDVFLAKYSPEGALVWAFKIGAPSTYDTGKGLAIDEAGNVIITGVLSGTADFDPGPGVFNVTSNSEYDLFVAKYSSDGGLLWAFSVGEYDFNGFSKVDTDDEGNVYVTGRLADTLDVDPGPAVYNLIEEEDKPYEFFVASYSSSGDFRWALDATGGNTSLPRDIHVRGDFVYVTGIFTGIKMDFDPSQRRFMLYAQPPNKQNTFVAKYNLNGQFISAFSLGLIRGSTQNFFGQVDVYAIDVDNNGNLLLAGGFTEEADFDPGPGSTVLYSRWADMFVAKYAPNGDLLFAFDVGDSGGDLATYPITRAFDLQTDSEGNIFLTGTTEGSPDFDPGPGKYILDDVPWGAFFAKYSSTGSFEWVHTAGYQGSSLALDRQKGVHVLGSLLNDPADFDPSEEEFILYPSGTRDIFVVKYIDAEFSLAPAAANEDDTGEFGLKQNNPNPFNPRTTIRFTLAEQAFARLMVYNILGQEVQQLVNGELAAGSHEVIFDATDLPSGTYLYKLETPQGSFTKTMLLIK